MSTENSILYPVFIIWYNIVMKRLFVYFLGACIFFGAGFVTATRFQIKTPSIPIPIISNIKEVRSGGYQFINPLIECDINQSIGQQEYRPSRNAILNLISQKKEQNILLDASVYYRDLNNGPWFGINELSDYAPASLLKVPVMMAYYKEAETNPDILTKKIIYTKDPHITEQYFLPKQTLEEGKTYTIDDLIASMIRESDNNATLILENNIPENKIDKVTADLGIETAVDTTPDDYMSVKGYASLYRVLYNASYLSPFYSEKALALLSQTDFPSGIAESLPKSIKVADKFGERELDNGVKQLHDCGIIYYPSHPYLLCVMTRGYDYNQLSTTIGDISKTIYDDLHKKYH